jgi:hypothetical protein
MITGGTRWLAPRRLAIWQRSLFQSGRFSCRQKFGVLMGRDHSVMEAKNNKSASKVLFLERPLLDDSLPATEIRDFHRKSR